MNSTNWVAVSPTITATDVLTSCCIPLPSPYHFFRVREGLVVTPYVPPVRITSITSDTNGVLLQWLAPTNSQFQVAVDSFPRAPGLDLLHQYPHLHQRRFPFLDDGSQSGGLAGPRYYRLQQLP